MNAYHIYVLYVWIEEGDETGSWRALLEEPGTGKRWGFTDPHNLAIFLEEIARTASPSSPCNHNTTL